MYCRHMWNMPSNKKKNFFLKFIITTKQIIISINIFNQHLYLSVVEKTPRLIVC